MANIYRYPFKEDGKTRAWVRFKQINYTFDIEDSTVKPTGGPSVYLYMPGNFAVADGANYTNVDLGIIGAGIEGAIRNGGLSSTGVDERITTALNAAGATFSEVVEAGTDFFSGGDMSPALITKLLQKMNAEDGAIGGSIQTGLRMTANPHTRALFKSVNLRSFSFDFDMIPDSAEEARQVKEIVKFFRTTMYPTYQNLLGPGEEDTVDINQLANQMTWNFPSMVEVDLFYVLDKDTFENADVDLLRQAGVDPGEVIESLDGNEVLTRIGVKILPCQITAVNTTFDSQGAMAFRPDGEPLGTKLSVSIQEDRALSRDKIEEGY